MMTETQRARSLIKARRRQGRTTEGDNALGWSGVERERMGVQEKGIVSEGRVEDTGVEEQKALPSIRMHEQRVT